MKLKHRVVDIHKVYVVFFVVFAGIVFEQRCPHNVCAFAVNSWSYALSSASSLSADAAADAKVGVMVPVIKR